MAGIPFHEVVVPLRRDDTKSRILAWSPSGKVPVLIDGENVIWDSLAILDYLAERFPERDWWPRDMAARGLARAISAEMHAGFPAVRNALSMDVLSRLPTPQPTSDLKAEIARIQALWADARSRFGASGPFLFRWQRDSGPMGFRSIRCRSPMSTRCWACRHIPNGAMAPPRAIEPGTLGDRSGYQFSSMVSFARHARLNEADIDGVIAGGAFDESCRWVR
jgi:hypothetical protein